MSYNRIIILGNLTRDPELRALPNGTIVARFSVATNEMYKKDGETVTVPTFFQCIAYGGTAETIAKYFKKGNRILVEGVMQQRSWQGRDGSKKTGYTVSVREFKFIDKKESTNTPKVETNNEEDKTGDAISYVKYKDDEPIDINSLPF